MKYKLSVEVQSMVNVLQSKKEYEICRSVAALRSCYCFIIAAAVIVLGRGALFLSLFYYSLKGYQAILVRP